MSNTVDILLDRLPPYQGKKRLIKSRQYTHDIIQDVMRKHRECARDYDRICDAFWQGSAADTAENLYWFARKHLPYQAEPTLTQTSKTPAAILEERGDFGNDCKHYASFIIGIGEALRRKGYPVKCFYRFASYNAKRRSPGHVFAVFKNADKEIWVDPVPQIGGFNRRHVTPFFVEDKTPPMADTHRIGDLYDICGLPSNRTVAGMRPNLTVAGTGTHWLDTLPVSGYSDVGKIKIRLPKIKVAKIKAPFIRIKPGEVIKKIGGAVPRNAYLGLLKMNAFNKAVQLHHAIKKDPKAWNKLHDFWRQWGGDPNKLSTAINVGVATHNKLHPGSKVSGDDSMDLGEVYYESDQVGVVPAVGAAALVAAAAPIIKAIGGILRSLGISNKMSEDATTTADLQAAQDHNNATDTSGDGNATVQPDGSVDHGNGVKTKVTIDPATGKQTVEYTADDTTDPGTGTSVDTHAGGPNNESGFALMLSNVTGFISDHKVWFIGGTIVILSIIVIPKIINAKKRRR